MRLLTPRPSEDQQPPSSQDVNGSIFVLFFSSYSQAMQASTFHEDDSYYYSYLLSLYLHWYNTSSWNIVEYCTFAFLSEHLYSNIYIIIYYHPPRIIEAYYINFSQDFQCLNPHSIQLFRRTKIREVKHHSTLYTMDSTKSSHHRTVNWWWVLFGGFLTVLNAVLLQQQQSYNRALLDTMRTQLKEAERRLSQSEQDSFQFSDLSVREIIAMGQLFFDHKSTYEELDDDLKDQLKQLNHAVPDQMEYLTESGYKMLSVKVSEKEKSTGELRASTIQAMTSRLREAGLVVIPSLHEAERCRKLAHKVHQDILDPWVEYGSIKRNEYRKDLPLQLHGDYLDILHDTLQLLYPVYKETLGESPVLKEFSSLTSYPGSGEQNFHSDASAETLEDFERDGLLYSTFIYLDDVGEFTAPFDAYPGTHAHMHIVDALMREEEGSGYENEGPYVRMTVPQGSMVIYDSRLIHRGSANTSPLTRPTLYFSLQVSNYPLSAHVICNLQYIAYDVKTPRQRKFT